MSRSRISNGFVPILVLFLALAVLVGVGGFYLWQRKSGIFKATSTPTPTSSAWSSRTVPPNRPECGLIYDGLEIDEDKCPGLYKLKSTGSCTHGPDPFQDCVYKESLYKCPETEWIDCIPKIGGSPSPLCSSDYLAWAKDNCPNFKGATYKSPTPSGSYTCPKTEWVNCMPGPNLDASVCMLDYLKWAKANCPGFKGAAY